MVHDKELEGSGAFDQRDINRTWNGQDNSLEMFHSTTGDIVYFF